MELQENVKQFALLSKPIVDIHPHTHKKLPHLQTSGTIFLTNCCAILAIHVFPILPTGPQSCECAGWYIAKKSEVISACQLGTRVLNSILSATNEIMLKEEFNKATIVSSVFEFINHLLCVYAVYYHIIFTEDHIFRK